jgi:hypothetical protein
MTESRQGNRTVYVDKRQRGFLLRARKDGCLAYDWKKALSVNAPLCAAMIQKAAQMALGRLKVELIMELFFLCLGHMLHLNDPTFLHNEALY